MIVAYVSGHGFGHSTRVSEVLRAVRAKDARVPIVVVTSAPAFLFADAVSGPLVHRVVECDVGLVQRDALTIDEAATVERLREFGSHWPSLVAAEASWLEGAGARVVLGDIPPLAFEAASGAGVPSLALANFSWDWIYRHYAGRNHGMAEAASRAEAAYGRAGLLLRLPFAGDLSAFPRIVDIPLIARRPRIDRHETRRRLAVDGRPVVLLSFGGIGLPGFRVEMLSPLREYVFLATAGVLGDCPDHVLRIDGESLRKLGLAYVDLVGAADVVVTKPGYGIVTDAIGAGARLVYTDRGDFAEYPILVREMARYLPCTHVSNDDLLAGRLDAPLREVLAQPVPPPPDMDGAEVASKRLLALWGSGPL